MSMARSNARHPASSAALKLDRTSWTGKVVTIEHAIPIRVLFEAFLAAESEHPMREVIDNYHVAVVTREKDGRLRAAGLASKMPEGWTWVDDPKARWRAVGIEVSGR